MRGVLLDYSVKLQRSILVLRASTCHEDRSTFKKGSSELAGGSLNLRHHHRHDEVSDTNRLAKHIRKLGAHISLANTIRAVVVLVNQKHGIAKHALIVERATTLPCVLQQLCCALF